MKKALRITAFVLAVLIALSGVWFLIIRPIIGKTATVMSSENYKITGAMMSYLVKAQMEDYIEQHTELYGKEYVENLGVNTEKSLKWQKSPYGESWFSYIYDKALNAMEETLLLCEAANDDGVTLTEKEIDAIAKAAKEYGKYGEENVLYVMKAKALAKKYEEKFYSSLSYDDADYQKYYEENRDLFDAVDYKYMEFSAVDTENFDTTVGNNKAKSAANRFANDLKTKDFDTLATEYLTSLESEKTVADFTVNEYHYETRTQFGNWAFEDGRKQGDIKIFEGSGQFALYYIEKAPYKLNYTTRRVQILTMSLGEDPYDTVDKMLVFYNKWQEMEQSEETFNTLSDKVTTETIYKENVSDKLKSWVYSDKREIGDWEVVEDISSLHLVRYLGEGEGAFTIRVKESLGESDFESMLKKAAEKYEIVIKSNIKRFVK